MLGTLPSTYLKWVSKKLRAGEFEDWAKLADEVLADPVYKDRIEWEFALNVMSGDKASSAVVARSGSAAVELQEISERFGWDNDDKVGWSKIDFNRLGTSYGGRIPRLVNRKSNDADVNADAKTNKKPSTGMSSSSRSKRMERRERQKMRLRSSSTHEEVEQEKEDMVADVEEVKDDDSVVDNNPFPGRQGLLRSLTLGVKSSLYTVALKVFVFMWAFTIIDKAKVIGGGVSKNILLCRGMIGYDVVVSGGTSFRGPVDLSIHKLVPLVQPSLRPCILRLVVPWVIMPFCGVPTYVATVHTSRVSRQQGAGTLKVLSTCQLIPSLWCATNL
ncbi:hypothetical protein TSUD_316460 [Trifolium subterraneum]|uniref:Uncharacterized protein n=1 Tax=Trifolium subterraneum TaxID=3900 RepID=A0A2Z6NJA0_TRISU|nr:hypothetical protein TSUD_316460 [Trifolium subterraneum]